MNKIELTPENCRAIASAFREITDKLQSKYGTQCGSVTTDNEGRLYLIVWPGSGQDYKSVKAETVDELFANVDAILDINAVAASKREQAAKLFAEAEKLCPTPWGVVEKS